jgi:23S rRNA-/tRNA-specific pseudouridylate synthase
LQKKKSILKDLRIENKIYLAICKGEVKEQHINLPIAKIKGEYIDWKYSIVKDGKQSHTYVKPIKTNQNYSLVEIKLFTGRQHQIRVHLQAIKHNIVGDKVYGESDKNFIDYLNKELKLPYNKEDINRQALHMHSIEINGRKIISEIPNDIKLLLKRIRL